MAEKKTKTKEMVWNKEMWLPFKQIGIASFLQQCHNPAWSLDFIWSPGDPF